MRLSLFLSIALCALMLAGCSSAATPPLPRSAQIQLPKKTILTTPPPQTPPATAPAKPAAGSPAATRVAEVGEKCPLLPGSVYTALGEPTVTPPRGQPIDGAKWVEALEGQVDTLKKHLHETAGTYNSCRGGH